MNRISISILSALTIASTNVNAWSLSVDKDAMTGKEKRSMAVESENNHKLSWPYGIISARLIVRQHPRYGKDILFIASNGQILCRSYGECTVTIKFDESPPLRLKGTEPSDNDSTVVFIPRFEQIVGRLKTAKKTMVEVEFYQNGPRVFEFDTSDFDPTKLETHKK